MKKRIYSFILCFAIMMSFINASAFAAEISDVKVEMPNITAVINANDIDKIDSSKVKVTLNGQELDISSAEFKNSSTEWIILIDTSKSTKTYFEAEKNAVLSVYNSLGENDKLSLYTFDTGIVTVLNGTESKEEAQSKIKNLACTGEDTVFYEATEKLISFISESKADIIIPVIFSDGVDTISKSANIDSVSDKLSNSSTPVYGFYADSLKNDTATKFNELLAKSKGEAKAFSSENATSLLSGKANNKQIVISATALSDVAAKDDAELIIDLGDGNKLSSKTKVTAWTAAETSAEQTEVESSTSINNKDEDDNSFPVIPIIIAIILIIAIVAVLFIFKKKKKTVKQPEETKITSTENVANETFAISSDDEIKAENNEDIITEEKKVKEKKPKAKKAKEEAQFQFYFVDKK